MESTVKNKTSAAFFFPPIQLTGRRTMKELIRMTFEIIENRLKWKMSKGETRRTLTNKSNRKKCRDKRDD